MGGTSTRTAQPWLDRKWPWVLGINFAVGLVVLIVTLKSPDSMMLWGGSAGGIVMALFALSIGTWFLLGAIGLQQRVTSRLAFALLGTLLLAGGYLFAAACRVEPASVVVMEKHATRHGKTSSFWVITPPNVRYEISGQLYKTLEVGRRHNCLRSGFTSDDYTLFRCRPDPTPRAHPGHDQDFVPFGYEPLAAP